MKTIGRREWILSYSNKLEPGEYIITRHGRAEVQVIVKQISGVEHKNVKQSGVQLGEFKDDKKE